MELEKEDSKMLQGLSVLAMVCLHLFDKDYHGVFTPLIFIQGIPLSFYVGQLADFCVFGFAFLSGYAHMKQFGRNGYCRRRLKGLLSVFCTYWLVLIVFSVMGIVIGQGNYMPGSIQKFVLNALTIESSYNGAWWYMFTYTLLVLTSPLTLHCVQKWNLVIVLGAGFTIYCAAYYMRFHMDGGWLLLKFGPFGMTFFEYLLGALVQKYRVFARIFEIWGRIPKLGRGTLSVALLLGLLYSRTKLVPSLFVAPISGFVIMMVFHFWEKPKPVREIFLFTGKHSTNIWLTHMFFYLAPFKNLVYLAKYPILILAFMMAITIPLSMLLQWIGRPIQKRVARL